MPWLAVEKDYSFEGPNDCASLLDLFDGRRQLIVFAPSWSPASGTGRSAAVSVVPWSPIRSRTRHIWAPATPALPSCRADHRTTFECLKAKMGWEHIPWYTLTDDFDADFDVDEWHGTNAFIRDGDRVSAPALSTAGVTSRWGTPGTIST